MAITINDELIKQWEPKIHKILADTQVRGYSKEDLEQELRISIIKAAKGFNEDRGVIFHTYLHTAMINTIRTLISKAQRQLNTQSIDIIDDDSDTRGPINKILQAIQDPTDSTEPIITLDVLKNYNLTDLEHRFLKLRMEGLTMDEITAILGESAYRIRHAIRGKVGDLDATTSST